MLGCLQIREQDDNSLVKAVHGTGKEVHEVRDRGGGGHEGLQAGAALMCHHGQLRIETPREERGVHG